MAKPIKPADVPRVPIKTSGKTLHEFRAAHDKNFYIPARISDALKKLGGAWEYEGEFIRLANVSQTDIGLFRGQFSDHIVETRGHNPKRVWCGTTELANQLREMVA